MEKFIDFPIPRKDRDFREPVPGVMAQGVFFQRNDVFAYFLHS